MFNADRYELVEFCDSGLDIPWRACLKYRDRILLKTRVLILDLRNCGLLDQQSFRDQVFDGEMRTRIVRQTMMANSRYRDGWTKAT